MGLPGPTVMRSLQPLLRQPHLSALFPALHSHSGHFFFPEWKYDYSPAENPSLAPHGQ